MERTTVMEAMRVSIFNVLETMFFQLVEITEPDCTLQEWFSENTTLLGSTLDFSGPWSGSFYLLIPANKANEITANFLGLEVEEVEESQREDAVKELLNMIGGGMLSQFDKKGAFRLGIPETIKRDGLAPGKLNDFKGVAIFVEAGGDRLAAGFHMD